MSTHQTLGHGCDCLDKQLIGLFAIADPVKESASQAIQALNEMGIHTVMLTGDNQSVANSIASKLGISQVIAQVLPLKSSA